MEKAFSEKSILVRAVMKVIDMILLDFLWLLFCVPVLTIGLATVAFFDTVQHEICFKDGHIISSFFASCKRNFKQGLQVGILLLLVVLALIADISLLKVALNHEIVLGNFWILFAIFLMFASVYCLWTFFYIANYEIDTKSLLKNSLLLMLGNLYTSLGLAMALIVSVLSVYLLPGSIFLTPVLCVLVCNRLLHSVFDKCQDKNSITICRAEASDDPSSKIVL